MNILERPNADMLRCGIRDAVEHEDWDTVTTLTEQLKQELANVPVKKKRGRPRKNPVKTDGAVILTQPQDFTNSSIKSSALTKNYKNKFIDTRQDHTEDTKKFDNIVFKGIKSERRDPIQKIKIHCSRCNNEYEVYPKSILPALDHQSPRYICDKCSMKGS